MIYLDILKTVARKILEKLGYKRNYHFKSRLFRFRIPVIRGYLVQTVLVDRGGGIGDVFFVIPALRGLKKKYPKARIIVQTRYPEIFDGNPFVDETTSIYKGQPADISIFMSYEDESPLTHHIVDVFCKCAKVPPQGKDIDLFLAQEEQKYAALEVEKYDGNVITIQPWPGNWTWNKNWYANRWAEVVKALGDYVVIQLGHVDEVLIDGAVDYRGKTTIRETAALIKHAKLHIACNSSTEQIAHAVGTPAIILYGSTHPDLFGYDNRQVSIYKQVECSPCYPRRETCEHRTCMASITVDDVVKAVQYILNQGLKE